MLLVASESTLLKAKPWPAGRNNFGSLIFTQIAIFITVTLLWPSRLSDHTQIEFQQAIEKHRQRIVTLARYSLRSAADADDIAQEVFVTTGNP